MGHGQEKRSDRDCIGSSGAGCQSACLWDNNDPAGSRSRRGTDVTFEGVYRPQPKKLGAGGTCTIKPLEGSGTEQCLRVELEGGVHGGYVAEGCLGGGTIKVWDQEE